MDEEMKANRKNNIWKLTKLPKDKQVISCKWVYHIKYKSNGSIDKYKVRLVAKGFAQIEGIDYKDIFSPTAKMITIYIMLVVVAHFTWKI